MAIAALAEGCGEAPLDLAEHGRELAQGHGALSPSRLYACTTCHDESADDASTGARKPGAPFAGATLRSTYWGGQEVDLLRALDACRRSFMLATEPLDRQDVDTRALYAYLLDLEPGDSDPVPFTIPTQLAALPRGNAVDGAMSYDRSCRACHGAAHDGAGRLGTEVPILPEEPLLEHADDSARVNRLHFIEKVRHGTFYDHGGQMPPLSLEVLSDEDLSDVLEFLGVLGE